MRPYLLKEVNASMRAAVTPGTTSTVGTKYLPADEIQCQHKWARLGSRGPLLLEVSVHNQLAVRPYLLKKVNASMSDLAGTPEPLLLAVRIYNQSAVRPYLLKKVNASMSELGWNPRDHVYWRYKNTYQPWAPSCWRKSMPAWVSLAGTPGTTSNGCTNI